MAVLVTDVFKSHLNFSKLYNLCVDLLIVLGIFRSSSGAQ